MTVYNKAEEAANFLKAKLKEGNFENGTVAVTLGSGLGKFGNSLTRLITVKYEEIPHFPKSTVEGHAGALILAKDEETGKNFWVMQGRVHYYEGYSMEQVTFPIRIFFLLGVKKFLVTNAAGGINRNFDAGDLMLIRDHINMFGNNPLIGPNDKRFGPRFSDMTEAYDKKLSKIVEEEAVSLKINIKEGVYFGWSGPTFETPSEVRLVAALGGDAVGMSTVPEVIVARHCGIDVAGISFISNKAAGISAEKLSHEEVQENSKLVEEKFGALVKASVTRFLKI